MANRYIVAKQGGAHYYVWDRKEQRMVQQYMGPAAEERAQQMADDLNQGVVS